MNIGKLALIGIVSFVIFFFGIRFFFGSKYGPDSNPDFTQSALSICDAYQVNGVAAEQKYMDKLIGLENVQVISISQSLTGVPQVIIPGGRIYFQHKESVADLMPGDRISCKAVLSVINGYDCQFEPCYGLKKSN